eukprot:SAG31_NODE_4005_length_3672_cov_2.293031_1_plen_208_part_00
MRADNLCYHFGLAERTRARVEDAGRVELADNEAAAMARSKESHIFMIVLVVLLGVSWAGGAWPDSETGDGFQRVPVLPMASGFALPIGGFWALGVFEAIEAGLEHRNKFFGLQKRVISHSNRAVEIVMRMGWIIVIRLMTFPIMVMFFGAATWGFGGNRDASTEYDEKVTREYWEAQGVNWTRLVSSTVSAARGPTWVDPVLNPEDP